MTSPESNGDAVIVENVAKTYGHGESAVSALREVSFHIRDGERVALLGKSGSGKSTLLNILGGLDRPTTGKVCVAGRDFATMSAKQMAEYRLSAVGMIFQSYNLIGSQTALRNVELPMIFSNTPPKERHEAAVAALRSVGLEQRMDHRPSELSGGEQQRVAIARALMNRPKVLLADEPTGNLDTKTAEEIVQLLTDFLSQSGTTFLLVTHDEHLAEIMAQRVLRMQDGRLVE